MSSIKIAVKIGDHDEAGGFLWGMMATVSVSFLCEEIRGQQEYLERVDAWEGNGRIVGSLGPHPAISGCPVGV